MRTSPDFMLNSTEHEISSVHKTKILTNKEVRALTLSQVLYLSC